MEKTSKDDLMINLKLHDITENYQGIIIDIIRNVKHFERIK
jgi:hypothetical protein